MLDTLRQCLEKGSFTLSPEFRKELAWFDCFLPTMDGTFIIHQDGRNPVQLYIDACMIGCRALTSGRVYHATFPPRVLRGNPPICNLEALNTTLAIKLWAPQLILQLLHVFCDNQAAVIIYQAG